MMRPAGQPVKWTYERESAEDLSSFHACHLQSVAMARPIDDVDRRLLALLREDARASLVQLGETLDLGHAAVHARIRRLRHDGYLKGFHAALDYDRLGFGLSAYIGLQVQQGTPLRARLAEALKAMPEVEEMAWVTGEFDAIVRVRARDTAHLQQVIFGITGQGDGQVRARTMVALSQPFAKPGIEFERVEPSAGAP
jgi:Lrp/AsnC family transcriptional regulator for asnA, asnC and gidA